MNLDVLPSVQRDKHPNYLVLYSFRPKKKTQPSMGWAFFGTEEVLHLLVLVLDLHEYLPGHVLLLEIFLASCIRVMVIV